MRENIEIILELAFIRDRFDGIFCVDQPFRCLLQPDPQKEMQRRKIVDLGEQCPEMPFGNEDFFRLGQKIPGRTVIPAYFCSQCFQCLALIRSDFGGTVPLAGETDLKQQIFEQIHTHLTLADTAIRDQLQDRLHESFAVMYRSNGWMVYRMLFAEKQRLCVTPKTFIRLVQIRPLENIISDS